MLLHRLSLVQDPDLGPVLWCREGEAGGAARPAASLDAVIIQSPPALAAALADHGGPLRQRVRVRRRTGPDQRVPVLPLDGPLLQETMTALRESIAELPGGDDLPALLSSHLEAGDPLALTPQLHLMAPGLRAVLLDLHAQRLVEQRRIAIRVRERFGAASARWEALEEDEPGILHDLIDARARPLFDAHLASHRPSAVGDAAAGSPAGAATAEEAGTTPAGSAAPEPLGAGLLGALSAAARPLQAEVPALRRLQRALDAYIDSGRARVHLASSDSQLVVRLFEPPLGTAWPLQTCLREPDGTIHPVTDLRAVGDVSIEGAAEASAEIMRLAPTVRTAQLDDTGVDWLLSTQEASAFLAFDTPALEAAGVTVLLPREWTKQRTRLTAVVGETEAASAEPRPVSGVGLRAMESFTWKVAVGDVDLTEEEIQEIREAQAELVQLRGQWVRLDPGTLRAAERFLDAFSAKARRQAKADGTALEPGAILPYDPQRQGGAGSAGAGAAEGDLSARGGLRLLRSPASGDASRDLEGSAGGAAEVSGSLDWVQLFSLLSGPESDGVDLQIVGDGWSGAGAGEQDAGSAGRGAASARGGASRPARGAGSPGRSTGGRRGPARAMRNTMRHLLPTGPGPITYSSPATLEATLRPYQLAGVDWMWALHEVGVGGILADDMGLGKTMQILALLCRERELGTASFEPPGSRRAPGSRSASGPQTAPGPTLLVCPMSVAGSWQREAARFAPHLRVHIHHGGDRIRDESFAEGAGDVDLVITTYSLVDRDQGVLAQVPWHRLVLDEAQHVKNPGTAVAKAARSLRAPHRIALTGTPVENRLGDLHAIMDLVNPGLLGPRARFQERLADPIEKDGDEAALAQFRALTSPFILRRVKTDRSIIDDLPEKIDLVRTVSLTPEQAGLYEAVVGELMSEIDGAEQNQRRTLVASALTRLKQICNHPAHYLGDGSGILRDGEHRSGKLEYVDDLLESAFADGERVLLFTQFTTFGHMLLPYWRERFGMDIPFLHGGVAKKDRDRMVADFQAGAGTPGAMLLSLRAGGTGLTLTAANHVVHLDRWWNPAVENQATDRAFRIGQTKDVQVRKLVAAGTIEERIDQVLADKQGLADLTVAPGEALLMAMDDAQLLSMLALTSEIGSAR